MRRFRHAARLSPAPALACNLLLLHAYSRRCAFLQIWLLPRFVSHTALCRLRRPHSASTDDTSEAVPLARVDLHRGGAARTPKPSRCWPRRWPPARHHPAPPMPPKPSTSSHLSDCWPRLWPPARHFLRPQAAAPRPSSRAAGPIAGCQRATAPRPQAAAPRPRAAAQALDKLAFVRAAAACPQTATQAFTAKAVAARERLRLCSTDLCCCHLALLPSPLAAVASRCCHRHCRRAARCEGYGQGSRAPPALGCGRCAAPWVGLVATQRGAVSNGSYSAHRAHEQQHDTVQPLQPRTAYGGWPATCR